MLQVYNSGLPTLCFKKVWILRKVLNVFITAGHRPAQAQEEPVAGRGEGGGAFLVFVWCHKMFLQNRVKILEF